MFRSSLRRFNVHPKIFFPPSDRVKTIPVEEITISETNLPRFSESWSMLFHEKSNPKNIISPWHNIPLLVPNPHKNATLDPKTNNLFHALAISPKTEFYYVNEISKGMREKLECSPKKEGNPIVQDRNKDGSLRKFTYGDMPFNYGFFPRTFEDPNVVDRHTGKLGDGDPVDVVFLTPESVPVGDIRKVRVVGCFGLLDQGETDWKVLCVPVDSPAKNIDDVPPEVQIGVYEWFKMYKTSDGKPENQFAFEGKPQDAHFTIELLGELSKQYVDVCFGSEGKSDSKKKLWIPQ